MTFKLSTGPKPTADASIELSVAATVNGYAALAKKITTDAKSMKRTDVSHTRRNASLKADVSTLLSEL